MLQAEKVILSKVFELFKSITEYRLGLDDSLEEYIYWLRFFAFERSTAAILENCRREDKYYDEVETKYGENWPENLPGPELLPEEDRSFEKQLEKIGKEAKGAAEDRPGKREGRELRTGKHSHKIQRKLGSEK